jgi:hypothetical protein
MGSGYVSRVYYSVSLNNGVVLNSALWPRADELCNTGGSPPHDETPVTPPKDVASLDGSLSDRSSDVISIGDTPNAGNHASEEILTMDQYESNGRDYYQKNQDAIKNNKGDDVGMPKIYSS